MERDYRADQVSIVDFETARVAALEYRGNPKFIGIAVRKLIEWRRLNNLPPKRSATYNIVYRGDGAEVHYDLCAATGRDVASNDFGVVGKTIPAGRCAVIRHIGSDEGIGEVAAYLRARWLPTSGENLRDFPMYFQRVRFPPEVPADEAVTDVFLPLK
ncbi:MAG: GyrI-like domain-containing protein [Steroidobacteraceae bacterium]|jgi:AraC family transcriptional regulator